MPIYLYYSEYLKNSQSRQKYTIKHICPKYEVF